MSVWERIAIPHGTAQQKRIIVPMWFNDGPASTNITTTLCLYRMSTGYACKTLYSRNNMKMEIDVVAIDDHNNSAECYYNVYTGFVVEGCIATTVYHGRYTPSQHETFTQCWYNVGPSSETLAQHCTNIGWTSRVCWAARYFTHRIHPLNTKDGRHVYAQGLKKICNSHKPND